MDTIVDNATPVVESTAAPAAETNQAPAANEPTLLGADEPTPAQTTEPTQEAAADDKPAEEDKPKGNENHGAPEGDADYADFTFEEGVEVDAALLTSVKGLAKELDLSQAGAQKLAEKAHSLTKAFGENTKATLAEAKKEWADKMQNDKEFGGTRLQENLGYAAKAMKEFATPELKQLLNESGLGNHPELVKAFIKVGKKMTGDNANLVVGNPPAKKDVPIANRIYPNNP